MDDALALTRAEDRLWGVRLAGDTLTLRPTGWQQLGALAQVGIAGAFLMLLYELGAQRQLLVGVAAAFLVVVTAVFQGTGTVVATPDGLTVWWFGRSRIPWDQVDFFKVDAHSPWWGGGWPPFDVVDATLRDGSTVTLWPTRSGPSEAADRPSPAMVQRDLLQRYRETFAPMS
jgi:hypothetical protein